MAEIAKELGSSRKWTKKQLARAETFSRVHPRVWWAFTELPDGKLKDKAAQGIVNQELDERTRDYLWRFADRLEDKESKVTRHGRPTNGSKVDVCGEVDTVTLHKGGRVVVDFDSDPGWRGRVILDEDDIRFENLEVRPEYRIRVKGYCLSRPTDSILMIGDRTPTVRDVRVEVVAIPGEDGWD